ncbi:MAG: T9SS type A sorting domain-containing protein [Dysgonomonas sp.]|nr:T9SS type A sorting domain-containing protein [Dysgonomonas sp.]
MKVKLLALLGMTAVPLLSVGQTNPVFYNKGVMSIVSTNANSTTLYVNGDFIAGGDATTQSEIHLDKSQTVITGNFVHNVPYDVAQSQGRNLFVLPSNYDSNKSKFVFRAADQANPTAQTITTTLAYDLVGKGVNYINFPDVEVENKAHLTVAPEIAMSVQGLALTKGKLILDSRRLTNTDANSTVSAHMYVASGTNKITYSRPASGVTDVNEFGAVQVKLALDQLDNTTNARSLVGMGSPYSEIRADYFMWNFLMFPYDNNIIGSLNFAETNPLVPIKAGKGFVVGVDLRGTDISNYDGTNNGSMSDTYKNKLGASTSLASSFANRNVEMITFDRLAFNNENNIFPLTGFTLGNVNFAENAQTISGAVYNNEQIVYNDVTVALEKGYNYLANPYTYPLSLKNLIDKTQSVAKWGVQAGETGETRDIISRAWVLNPTSKASGLHNVNTPTTILGKNRLHATYSYLLMKNVGGTFSSDLSGNDVNKFVVAPLQMFVIYAVNSGTATQITIPQSERILGTNTHFLRSTDSNITEGDDYLFEVTDLTTKTYDRAAIVLRTPQQILTSSEYKDSKKLVSNVVSDSNTKSALAVVSEEGVVSQTAASMIYTKDAEGNAIESLFLPTADGATEVSTILYLSPSLTAQKIGVTAKRLETMDRATEIWLTDKLNNKKVLLSNGNTYETTIRPTDVTDRFTLRFVLASSGIGDETGDTGVDKSISSYYANGVLTVTGFDESDFGSTIFVYDIQGKLIAQEKVNELRETIEQDFMPGAYIVKVVGNKSYVSKFLVK